MDSLSFYEKRMYSQNGEDGIIEELFARIGTTNRLCVEFGVSDGLQCMSRHLLVNHGWSGLLIEADPDCFCRLAQHFGHAPGVKLCHSRVTKENIAPLFRENGVPDEFDFLSIDIDGNDYWVWQALHEWKPRVIVIEYNASFPPPQKMVIAYDPDFRWDGTSHFGASLSSLAELGKRLGYALIGTDTCGVNAFFLRRDLLEVSRFAELSPEQAYHAPAYGPDGGGHPRRNGPYLDI